MLGVSSDSLETHAEFRRKYNIAFPLISDEDAALRRAYGWGRVTFLIDKDGIVRYIQKGVPRNDEFLREIRKVNEESRPLEEKKD